MITNRFRTATLALAGAALIATSLMSSAAMAAPSESRPTSADAETVAAKPHIDIPKADMSVILSKMTVVGMPKYTFTVRNHGPERASVKVKIMAAYYDCNNCDIKSDKVEETVTMNANTSREYQVECKSTMITLCSSAYGEVKVTGVDPDLDDNIFYLPH